MSKLIEFGGQEALDELQAEYGDNVSECGSTGFFSQGRSSRAEKSPTTKKIRFAK
jgi:hypothetical protein